MYGQDRSYLVCFNIIWCSCNSQCGYLTCLPSPCFVFSWFIVMLYNITIRAPPKQHSKNHLNTLHTLILRFQWGPWFPGLCWQLAISQHFISKSTRNTKERGWDRHILVCRWNFRKLNQVYSNRKCEKFHPFYYKARKHSSRYHTWARLFWTPCDNGTSAMDLYGAPCFELNRRWRKCLCENYSSTQVLWK